MFNTGSRSLLDPFGVESDRLRPVRRGNVPQNLTDPVTVVFATPRADRAKGKGMKLGGRVHAASGGETQW